ncbi:hypothetical protein AAMO2058_000847500 [Amorphochlora amoebiformis]|mmetsp:Transcript_31037/g.49814  ORF Transcript_31037/g.49814 Transcript_31037/m.49814 type:complete len:1009 (-) Transcript_31037:290-3316(-)
MEGKNEFKQIESIIREQFYEMEGMNEYSDLKMGMSPEEVERMYGTVAKELENNGKKIGTTLIRNLSKFSNTETQVNIIKFYSLAEKAGLLKSESVKSLLLAFNAASEVLFLVKPIMVILNAFCSACRTDLEVRSILSNMSKMTNQLWVIMVNAVGERCRGIEGKNGLLENLKTQIRRVLNVILTLLIRMKPKKKMDGAKESMKVLILGENILKALENGNQFKDEKVKKVAKRKYFEKTKFWIKVYPSKDPKGGYLYLQASESLYGSQNLKFKLPVDHVERIISAEMPESPLREQVRNKLKIAILKSISPEEKMALEKCLKQSQAESLEQSQWMGFFKGTFSSVFNFFGNKYRAEGRKELLLELEKGLEKTLKCAHFSSTLQVMNIAVENNKLLEDLHTFHERAHQCHTKIDNKELQKIWEVNFPHLQCVDIQDLSPEIAKWMHALIIKEKATVRLYKVTWDYFEEWTVYELTDKILDALMYLDIKNGRGYTPDLKVHYVEANNWFPEEANLRKKMEAYIEEARKWKQKREGDNKKNLCQMKDVLTDMDKQIKLQGQNVQMMKCLKFLVQERRDKLKKERERARKQKFQYILNILNRGPKTNLELYKVAVGLILMAKMELEDAKEIKATESTALAPESTTEATAPTVPTEPTACVESKTRRDSLEEELLKNKKDFEDLQENRHYKAAMKYLEQAADDEEKPEPAAIKLLVTILWENVNKEENSNKILELLERLLKFGNMSQKADAAFYKSLLYRDLHVLQTDEKKSDTKVDAKDLNLKEKEIEWAKKALQYEKRGYIFSNLALSVDSETDKENYLRKGAALNDSTCLYGLAEYKKKKGGDEISTTEEGAKEVELLEKAAKNNFVPSLFTLGEYHIRETKRKNFVPNYKKGVSYLQQASEVTPVEMEFEPMVNALKLLPDGTKSISGPEATLLYKQVEEKLKPYKPNDYRRTLVETRLTRQAPSIKIHQTADIESPRQNSIGSRAIQRNMLPEFDYGNVFKMYQGNAMPS